MSATISCLVQFHPVLTLYFHPLLHHSALATLSPEVVLATHCSRAGKGSEASRQITEAGETPIRY